MSSATVIFFLLLGIIVLIGILFYQQFLFRSAVQKQLRTLSRQLKKFIDADGDGPVLVFTENGELMELAAQINRLLESHQKVKADYRRSRIASQKMLSNISHDIKTPMTVILGYLEIMRLNGGGTDEMLQKTEQKAKDLMELVNQFFTLAKLEAGDMEPELSSVDVCEICRKSILDFYEILASQNFQVNLTIPESPVYALGNEESLRRILSNLISNVLRYGADGNYLGLSLRADNERISIDVTDKGKGVGPLFADRIFDRLFTMEDAKSRNIKGNGLGLAIAKNLAFQLGGTITLDSTPYVDTTFTVTLKKAPD